MDNLGWLQSWYSNQLTIVNKIQNIEMGTIDNPGRYFKINLNNTHLEKKCFENVQIDRTEDDWVYCRVKDNHFEGFGGLYNLCEIIQIFYEWNELTYPSSHKISKQFSINNYLFFILKWFHKQCDNDWEHMFGIKISTLDNSGWHIQISIEETELQDKIFQNINIERSKKEWLSCKVTDGHFEGFCGPFILNEVLQVFCDWAEKDL